MEKYNENAQNIKQFVELIERYESLTFEEIKKEWERSQYQMGHQVAQIVTGFGGSQTCTLCLSIDGQCLICVYGANDSGYGCLTRSHTKTYNDIDDATTPRKLFNAFKRRAAHMRKYYPQYFK